MTPSDVEWIGSVVESWARTHRWSLQGQTPSPQLLQRWLWQEVQSQQVAWMNGSTPAGLFQLAGVRRESGYAYLELLVDEQRASELESALRQFMGNVFRDLTLRKLCVSALADELDVPSYVGPMARLAGCLVDHERRGEGKYVNLLMYEVWKADIA